MSCLWRRILRAGSEKFPYKRGTRFFFFFVVAPKNGIFSLQSMPPAAFLLPFARCILSYYPLLAFAGGRNDLLSPCRSTSRPLFDPFCARGKRSFVCRMSEHRHQPFTSVIGNKTAALNDLFLALMTPSLPLNDMRNVILAFLFAQMSEKVGENLFLRGKKKRRAGRHLRLRLRSRPPARLPCAGRRRTRGRRRTGQSQQARTKLD